MTTHKIEPSLIGQTALVTGASSGIGAATARLLAKQGMKVILVARRLERLLKLKSELNGNGSQVEVFPVDLTNDAERVSFLEKVKGGFEHIDLLINNAGLGWYGYFAEMPWKTAKEMLSLNVAASLHLTSEILPNMLRRNQGHIINIGSIAGGFPNQGVAVYSATKSFLDAFTSSLYRETRGSQVRVSIVRAGPVKTEFSETAFSREAGRHIPTERVGVSADRVAKAIWGLFKRPRKVIYVPGILRFTPWLESTFGWLIDRLGPVLLRQATD